MLASSAVEADVCSPYAGVGILQPAVLVTGVSGEALPNSSNDRIPFAGIWVGPSDLYVGVQGNPASAFEQGTAECHARAGVAVSQADDSSDLTPPHIASNASYDAHVVDGRIDVAALAGVSQSEAVDQVVLSSNAEVEIGFREVFDVVSEEVGMRDLQIDWSLAGGWTQIGCSGGEFHQPPVRVLRLKVFSDPPVGSTLKVLDINFSGAPGNEVLEFERLDTAQVHANGIVSVDVWFQVRAFVTRENVYGDPPDVCYGGDSNADFFGADEGLSIAFHNPDPAVSIVPRSGIAYSATVPEPDASALLVVALAALCALAGRAWSSDRRGHRR